LRIKI